MIKMPNQKKCGQSNIVWEKLEEGEGITNP